MKGLKRTAVLLILVATAGFLPAPRTSAPRSSGSHGSRSANR